MPFAGRMRMSTFLAGLGGCAVGGLGLAFVGMFVLPVLGVAMFDQGPRELEFTPPPVVEVASAPVAAIEAPVEAPVAATDPVPAAPAPAVAAGARDVDALVLGYQGKDLGSDKAKDVTGGRTPYKVNVYQDAGHPTANRAKIDLDRDEKWDEKVTFEDGKITRQVAPADDENYSQTFHWIDGTWKPE